ncbi:MAG TPA: aldolase/citrate lyase family protein [Acidobacteriota bacterium]|nr:aldolase/citrate lyase family protein [Acidobacteriota bacterium]
MKYGLLSCIALFLVLPVSGQTQWENPVKKMLKEGKPVVGLTVTVPSAEIAVQAANLGFDFLWIEMEHSAITLESARNIVLATQGTRTVPIIRVPINELWTAKRALDIGALGVIFPFTSTPELAKQAVAACKYPPYGLRGSGPGLASMRWPAPGGYADFADKNALVIIIIEQRQAVDRIDEILDVPGIDVAFIGPNDLSHSYGFRGQQSPEVKEAIAKVVSSAKKHNIPVGRTAGAADILDYVKEGFTFFQASSELGMMAAGSRPLLDTLGKKGPDPKNRTMY